MHDGLPRSSMNGGGTQSGRRSHWGMPRCGIAMDRGGVGNGDVREVWSETDVAVCSGRLGVAHHRKRANRNGTSHASRSTSGYGAVGQHRGRGSRYGGARYRR